MDLRIRYRANWGPKVIDRRAILTDPRECNYPVYCEDGPKAGEVIWRPDTQPLRILVMPGNSRLPVTQESAIYTPERILTYTVHHQQFKAGPYLWKDAFVAECGEPGPLDSRNNFRQYLAEQPWRKSQPAGSRDFEGWWAMRMIELGRAKAGGPATEETWLAVEWLRLMEPYNRI
jgi:hypothetical protein